MTTIPSKNPPRFESFDKPINLDAYKQEMGKTTTPEKEASALTNYVQNNLTKFAGKESILEDNFNKLFSSLPNASLNVAASFQRTIKKQYVESLKGKTNNEIILSQINQFFSPTEQKIYFDQIVKICNEFVGGKVKIDSYEKLTELREILSTLRLEIDQDEVTRVQAETNRVLIDAFTMVFSEDGLKKLVADYHTEKDAGLCWAKILKGELAMPYASELKEQALSHYSTKAISSLGLSKTY